MFDVKERYHEGDVLARVYGATTGAGSLCTAGVLVLSGVAAALAFKTALVAAPFLLAAGIVLVSAGVAKMVFSDESVHWKSFCWKGLTSGVATAAAVAFGSYVLALTSWAVAPVALVGVVITAYDLRIAAGEYLSANPK